MSKLQLSGIQGRAILAAKEKAASALDLYRPTEQQEEVIRAFERDDLLEMLLGGGNRAGKSLLASIIITAAILNKPITFRDGSQHHMRPERWREEPLKIWIVGYDWDHIGKTLHRLLLQPGAFRVVRDPDTGKMRTWNPETESKKNTRPSPAMLRVQDIVDGEVGLSWENKKEHQVSSFDVVHDETRVEFFPSTGAIPQGDPAHIIWIDEKIDNGKWYSELLARLIDHEGRLLWTAWPSTEPSDEMSSLADRAKEQEGKSDQSSFAFKLKGSDNPYTRSKHRDAIMATMDEDTRSARDDGNMNNDRWRLYPRFNKYVHRAYSQDATKDDLLAKTIREKNGIPSDWTRYLILDPGTANPAVLFVAVPPPNIGDFIVPYDELYLHYTSAEPLAQAVAAKLGITDTSSGQVLEDLIIDAHAARQTPMGFDGTIGENYEKYFAKAKIKGRRHGTRFSPGSDNVTTRVMRVQGSLNLRQDGQPRLRILGCPHLVRQLENARWGKNPKGDPSDKPYEHQKIDVSSCLEYFVSRDDCGYFKPPPTPEQDKSSPAAVMRSMNSFFGRQMNTPSDRSVYCGAGSPRQF